MLAGAAGSASAAFAGFPGKDARKIPARNVRLREKMPAVGVELRDAGPLMSALPAGGWRGDK